jgi:ER-bound oxygenase mpaB/B'/Rubber oxygenase, catalytic domain
MSANDLDHFRRLGDKEVDAIVDSACADDKACLALLKMIGMWEPGDSMSDLPAEFRDFLERPLNWPRWASPERLTRAQNAYSKLRLRSRLVLAHASLPSVYLCAETSLTLTKTGQLLLRPRRRLLETIRFVEALMQPRSFDRGGDGPKWVRKVRLTHALVRKMVLATPAVGAVRDAMPLDQLELAFVLQTFGWVVVYGLPRMGKAFPDEQSQEDYIHAWSMIGAELGIQRELLPQSKKEAQCLFERIRSDLLAYGDPLTPDKTDPADTRLAARLLTASLYTILVQIMRERLPARYRSLLIRFKWLDEALQALPRTLMRRLCGVRTVRHLRIGRAPFFHWLIGELALRLIDLDAVADYPLEQHRPPATTTPVGVPAYLSLFRSGPE